MLVLYNTLEKLIIDCILINSFRAIGNMIFTLMWPLFPFLLQLVLFAYWGAVAIFLASSGKAEYQSAKTNITALNTSTVVNNQTFQNVIENIIDKIPCDPAVSV